MQRIVIALLLGMLAVSAAPAAEYDCVVYGGAPGAVTAAVAAARQGERVALVSPDPYLGGVVSGGLTRTDIGRADTVGGLAREFFNHVRDYYVAKYGANSQQVRDSQEGIYFEPHVAREQFAALVAAEPNIRLFSRYRLGQVSRHGNRITAITAIGPDGKEERFQAAIFIDGSYEGDLMAGAKVPYHVGREGRDVYGEEHAGVRYGAPETIGQGDRHVQAYNYRLCLTDRPDLRVLPTRPADYDPARYQILKEYLITQQARTLHPNVMMVMPVPNGKYDANNSGYPWQSTDWVGHSDAYPEASFAERERLRQDHLRYVQGVLYFVQNDPGVPAALREDARRYGLARDEFTETGNWPDALYVREARRMIGSYVFTEKDATADPYKPDGIAIGSYTIDCHGCQWIETQGKKRIEGGMGVRVKPYEIPYGVLIPKQVENLLVPVCCSASHVGYATLRMEPVYMMLGHAAGVAAHLARAAGKPVQQVDVPELRRVLRIQGQLLDAPFSPVVEIASTPAQPTPGQPFTLSAKPIRQRTPFTHYWWDFDGDGTVDSEAATPTLTRPQAKRYTIGLMVQDAEGNCTPCMYGEVTVGAGGRPDITVDDRAATYHGAWEQATSLTPYIGEGYRHDGNADKGKACRFTPDLPEAGRYQVCIAYQPHENRAGKIPVTIFHAGGSDKVLLDERTRKTPFPFVSLGVWEFPAGKNRDTGSVLIQTADTDGYVVVDAVRFIRVPDK